jgi:hypothetical protein
MKLTVIGWAMWELQIVCQDKQDSRQRGSSVAPVSP